MNIHKLDWFYVENITKSTLKLSDDESRHLKVKRHGSNEKIAVFDGKGTVGVASIVDKNKVSVESIHEIENDASVTIASCVPKGDKFDFMIQKLTELNVKTIIPLKAKYSVALPSKVDRMKRIAIEACKQCKRAYLPEVTKLTDFSDVVRMNADIKVILDQEGKKLYSNRNVIVLVGPEAGFTEDEIALAEKHGFIKASVGKNTLRIETAAIAAASILNQ